MEGNVQVASLSFCFEQVGPREQALFKSFLRLLEHRLPQRWCAGPGPADLTVVPAPGGEGAGLLLRAAQQARRVALPIHADELEAALRALGAVLARGTAAAGVDEAGAVLRLLRWPPAALLVQPGALRVAAVLSSRPLPLAELARTARVAPADCCGLLRAWSAAGVLEQQTGAASTRPVAALPALRPGRGLIARIRDRLGLQA